jgi:hypothetical protein
VWFTRNHVDDATNWYGGKITKVTRATDKNCKGISRTRTFYDIAYDDGSTRAGLYADEIVAVSSLLTSY